MKTIDARPQDLEKVLAMGAGPLPASVMADVLEAFRESDLPFKVDVVDWATTRDSFRRIIEREFVLVRGEVVSA